LTPEQIANAGLAFATVVERPVAEVLEATAEIEPAPSRFAQVGARVTGRVTRLLVAEGDKVSEGEAVAEIESQELGQATGDYLASVTQATVAREIADREKRLFDRQISSEREWRQAEAEAVRARSVKEAAENRLHAFGLSDEELRRLQVDQHFSSKVTVRTPLSGIVASRAANIGRIVQPGDGLFEVVDLSEVAIAIDVYEQSLTRVRSGQRVEVETMSTGNAVFEGRVTSVGAVVERQTRTVKVRVLLANPEKVLRPGMFATVRVLGARADSVNARGLYVPSAAIQRDGGATVVFVRVDSAGRFERREVGIGPETGGFTQILRGLRSGEVVVTTGSLTLKSEFRKGTLGEPE
jgi:cobalt-zinc-cadmium efflux system membrane fusion protein